MKNFNLSEEYKKKILHNLIIPYWSKLHQYDANFSTKLLDNTLDLRNSPSTDHRFDNALQDYQQHFIRNNDWSIEYLFEDRFNFYSNDELVIDFTLQILNNRIPNYEIDSIELLAIEIDKLLKQDNYCLLTIDFDKNGNAVYEIANYDKDASMPFGIKANNIPFFLDDYFEIGVNEYFRLNSSNWDDYGTKSTFNLSYVNGSLVKQIGPLKIINSEEKTTINILPKSFTSLTSDYCSLAQVSDFYINMLGISDRRFFESICYALKDASIYPLIGERFENQVSYRSSLIRNDEAERILRETRHKYSGNNLWDFYQFNYLFSPPYSKQNVEIPFNYKSDSILNDRIIAIVGKNAVGKTNLLSNLPINISQRNIEYFPQGKIPSFSKIIAVSFSVFDNFKIPKINDGFNYVYCGLREDEDKTKDNKALQLRFHMDLKKVISYSRYTQWREIVTEFISEELLNSFAPKYLFQENEYKAENFANVRNQFSSGQAIMLFIITSIIANIRYDSLLIFDEPETHLHPNAIVKLMNVIFNITTKFQSFCIIATHSPFIIRELFSRNVWVLERNFDIPSIRKIHIESFGESISTISNEIFRDRETRKTFIYIINQLKELQYTKEQVYNYLKSDDIPLSLEALMEVELAFKSI